MGRIKIISKTENDYKYYEVIDMETGKPISGVTRAEIIIDAGGEEKAILHIWKPEIEIEINDTEII